MSSDKGSQAAMIQIPIASQEMGSKPQCRPLSREAFRFDGQDSSPYNSLVNTRFLTLSHVWVDMRK